MTQYLSRGYVPLEPGDIAIATVNGVYCKVKIAEVEGPERYKVSVIPDTEMNKNTAEILACMFDYRLLK